ncbi:MAG: glycosyl transferase family 1 [Firmicutes bacterium]|nr:glycosyl transferase family 1 [Bacillota bacterium]
MDTIIFFGVPAHGHINPTLPIVEELITRGKRIIYYCTEDFKDIIENSGALFRPYKIGIMNKNNKLISKNFISLTRSILESTDDIINHHLEEVKGENPVCIVHDSFCTWGRCIAKVLNIRAVCSTTIFPIGKKFLNPGILMMMLSRLGDLIRFKKLAKYYSKKYNIEVDLKHTIINKEELNIVYTSRYFQPKSEEIDESYKYVGPSINHRDEDLDFPFEKLRNRKVIYISLGTLLNQNISFYQKCLKTFAQKEFLVIMSVGKNTEIKELGEIPDNFIVKNYVPQIEVLQRADLFISHAGMNSVHEALYFGVPLILVPQQPEQLMIGKRIEELGAGICLNNKEINENILRDSADKIMKHQSYLQNTNDIKETFRKAGGYKGAVDIILDTLPH